MKDVIPEQEILGDIVIATGLSVLADMQELVHPARVERDLVLLADLLDGGAGGSHRDDGMAVGKRAAHRAIHEMDQVAEQSARCRDQRLERIRLEHGMDRQPGASLESPRDDVAQRGAPGFDLSGVQRDPVREWLSAQAGPGLR